MAKFTFRFESILSLRRQLEESMKNELGKALKILEDEKSVLKDLEDENNSIINEINYGYESGITIDKLKSYNGYLSLLKSKINIQKESINEAQKNVDKYREQLVVAMQDRKIIEKLKEKKLEEYYIEENKKEQKLIDELVSYKQSRVGDMDG